MRQLLIPDFPLFDQDLDHDAAPFKEGEDDYPINIRLMDKYRYNKDDFGDICWSVEADSDNTESIGETDLVAFNKDTFSLHFISCKVAGPHGQALDHIQGLRRRATKEGGKFSKAELWIFAPKSEDSKQSLTKHCMEQNVSLHILSEELSK